MVLHFFGVGVVKVRKVIGKVVGVERYNESDEGQYSYWGYRLGGNILLGRRAIFHFIYAVKRTVVLVVS